MESTLEGSVRDPKWKEAAMEDTISEQRGHQAHSHVASPVKLPLWLRSTLRFPCYNPPQDIAVHIFLFFPIGLSVFGLGIFFLPFFMLMSPVPVSRLCVPWWLNAVVSVQSWKRQKTKGRWREVIFPHFSLEKENQVSKERGLTGNDCVSWQIVYILCLILSSPKCLCFLNSSAIRQGINM